ncbi:MAG: CaiB/BaiF CoA-transferase family protein [Alphaproteobacteria bacterium]
MAGPFSHIRVLDLSRILAGPWAAQMLADLGAEVIKIERRGEGDDTRKWGPPFLKDADGKETAESAYYLSTNRGKKSVTVDLATPRGQALVATLADRSQVVIENFRVGGAARFGLDYETLAARNPSLVYCSITGFGQTGPYRDRGGYDFMIQAMGGLMSITGETDDRPGGGPQKAGLAVSDLFTGMYASVAINAALAHRERTGEGQHIDLALLDSTVAILSMMASNYFLSGTPPTRMGNAHPNVAPYRLFATADGHVVVAIGNDAQFGRYCTEIGLPAIAADPRFRDNSARLANRDALDDILSDAMMARTTGEWLAAFEAINVPSAPVNDVAQVFADPQVIARGMKIGLPHELGVEAPHAASPIKLSATPVAYTGSAPTLGGQTDQVLSKILELDPQEIAALRAENII